MKTAVSIPDDVFLQAEELAQREGKSRSQVYREALVEYLLRRDPATITEAIDRVVEEVGTSPDAWSTAAGRQVLSRVEW